jgi:dihydrolipoamide dehydrogenase
MLAHKASEEGIALADIIAGVTSKNFIHYRNIPSVAYTHPEMASVGYNERELQQEKIAYKIAKFPLAANGRAQINQDTEAWVKLIYSPDTQKLLGATIISNDAGNLIHNYSLLLEFKAHAADVIEGSFAHPTVAESVKEAAMLASWDGKAIHFLAKKP